MTIHPQARTTPRVRAEIQAAPPTVTHVALARQLGINVLTVRKWRKRTETADRSHRPLQMHTRLNEAQEAVLMEVRRLLWLSLDDLLVVGREFLCAQLSRSALSRCLVRHGLNQRPVEDKPRTPTKSFKDYAPGFVHVDIKYLPQMADETQRRYLFVAIDRATRWVYLELLPDKSQASALRFLKAVRAKAPFKIQKLLTDNDSAFTDRFTQKDRRPSGAHPFDQQCQQAGIEHRLCPPRHPQTNGMVERFNGRISDILATTRFDGRADLETTLKSYLQLYNHHLPQRSLNHQTPIQALKDWQLKHPDLFVRRVYDQAGLDRMRGPTQPARR